MPEQATQPRYIGRCIAPHVDAAKFEHWRNAIQAFPESCQAAATSLWELLSAYKLGELYTLPDAATRQQYAQLFESLTEPDRTPAFHMLWCVNEIALGRSPNIGVL